MRSGRQPGLRGFVLIAAATASVAVLGCGKGDPDEIPTVPAAGTITYKGKPLESGSIQFVPEKGRSASGRIKDGHFILTTYKEEDGAIPGKHQVGVTSTRDIPKKTGGDPTVEFIVPSKFSDFTSSGLEAVVPAEGTTTLKIEIP